MQVWIEDSESWSTSMRLMETGNVDSATSSERRRFEFEFQSSEPGELTLNGAAFYNVCPDDGPQCLFRRQDFVVSIDVEE